MGGATGPVPLGCATAHFWRSRVPRRYNCHNDIGNNWKNDISRHVKQPRSYNILSRNDINSDFVRVRRAIVVVFDVKRIYRLKFWVKKTQLFMTRFFHVT